MILQPFKYIFIVCILFVFSGCASKVGVVSTISEPGTAKSVDSLLVVSYLNDFDGRYSRDVYETSAKFSPIFGNELILDLAKRNIKSELVNASPTSLSGASNIEIAKANGFSNVLSIKFVDYKVVIDQYGRTHLINATLEANLIRVRDSKKIWQGTFLWSPGLSKNLLQGAKNLEETLMNALIKDDVLVIGKEPSPTTPINVDLKDLNLVYSPELLAYYPTDALLNKYQGEVVVRVTISTSGYVTSASVVKASNVVKDLDEGAITMAKNYRFKPYLINKVPTSVATNITIKFDLNAAVDTTKFDAKASLHSSPKNTKTLDESQKKLDALKGLLNKGLISSEDYEKQKKLVLDSM